MSAPIAGPDAWVYKCPCCKYEAWLAARPSHKPQCQNYDCIGWETLVESGCRWGERWALVAWMAMAQWWVMEEGRLERSIDELLTSDDEMERRVG